MIKSIRGSICEILVLGKSTQAEYFRVYSAAFGFCSSANILDICKCKGKISKHLAKF